MSAAQFLSELKVNLKSILEPTNIGPIAEGDANSHKIKIELYQNSDKIIASGTVNCIVVQDSGDYFTFSGSISNGDIIVEIPNSACTVKGPLVINVRLITNGVRTVVAILKSYVVLTTTSSPIDPENIQPTSQEVLDVYAEMVRLSNELPDEVEELEEEISEFENVTNLLFNETGVNYTNVTEDPRIINSDGEWVGRGSGDHYGSKTIEIPEWAKKVQIIGNAENGSIFAFLENNYSTGDSDADFSPGYGSRISIGNGVKKEYAIKSGMNYLYALTTRSNDPEGSCLKTPTVKFGRIKTDITFSETSVPADAGKTGWKFNEMELDIQNISGIQLPSGYVQLKYIESSGTQYIRPRADTYHSNQDSRVVIVFEQTAEAVADTENANYLFGDRINTSNAAFYIQRTLTGNVITGYGTDSSASNPYVPMEEGGISVHLIDFNKNKIYYDGTLIKTKTEQTFSTPNSPYLFRIRTQDPSSSFYGKYRVYRYKQYDNGVLAVDLIPCRRTSDNAIGMYDLINANFVENRGTGTFIGCEMPTLNGIAENVKEKFDAYVTKLPDGYKQIEYIESTGSQIVDTGFKPKQNTKMIVDFLAKKTGATNIIFGSRRNQNEDSQTALMVTVTSTNLLTFSWNTSYGGAGMQELGVEPIEYDFRRHKIEVGPGAETGYGVLKIDDNTVYTLTTTGEFTGKWTARLFGGARTTGTTTFSEVIEYGYVRIYGAQVYDNGNLIHDYVPCICLSDNQQPGMYDLVNGTFAPMSNPIIGDTLSAASNYEHYSKIESDVNDLKNKISERSYIQAEADRVAAKVRSVQNNTSLTFVAISDLHYSVADDLTKSISASDIRAALEDMRDGVKAIAKQIPIDFYTCFGDIIYQIKGSNNANFYNGVQESIDVTKLINDAFGNNQQIRLVGNHDPNCANIDNKYFTPNEMNSYTGAYSNMLTKDSQYSYGAYGYHDFIEQKIRLIVLNTSFYSGTITNDEDTRYYIGDAQANWLCDRLMMSNISDPQNWQIIIFSHVVLDYGARKAIGKYSNILTAYYTGSEWGSKNFSGHNSAKLALYVNGHAHKYLIRNMREIDITQDSQYTVNYYHPMASLYIPNALPGRDEESIDGVTYSKTPNTVNSTSFYIVTLDYSNKIVYAHHYGRGIDIIMHYESESISTSKTYTTTLISPVWHSSNTDVATVNNGTVTPEDVTAAACCAMIWAKSETDNCIEVWNINVPVPV